jgi:FMN reductase
VTAGSGPLRLVILIAHPHPQSRTAGIARRAVTRLRDGLMALGVDVGTETVVDLAGFVSPHDRLLGVDSAGDALATVREADVLVVVSPTFKGSYTGLLKFFVDLLPRTGLAGVLAVPVMTAGLPVHRHVVDTHLRPLLLELGARVPVSGLTVLESDFDALDDVLSRWCGGAAAQVAAACTDVAVPSG